MIPPCGFAFVPFPGCARLPNNFQIIILHTPSYKMQYFLSNIHTWTLAFIAVENSSAVFSIYLKCGQPVYFVLFQDGAKTYESLIRDRLNQQSEITIVANSVSDIQLWFGE